MKKIIWFSVFLFVFYFNTASAIELESSVNPNPVTEGEQMVVKFNDVGADYYVLSASCKDSIIVDGKDRLDLCDKDLKMYPTGKDVIAIYGFYPSVIGSSSSFQLTIAAYKNGTKIKADTETIKVVKKITKPDLDEDGEIEIDDKISHASDTAILKLVINILKADGSSDNAQLVQILELIISLLEK